MGGRGERLMFIVVGCKGQVGWELLRLGEKEGIDIHPLDLPDFDITNPEAVHSAVKGAGASLVINAAAYTAVDQAESDQDPAFAVNRDGPLFLASACAEAGIPLIHISTDYVYDGEKRGAYIENDPVSPLGVYGRSKAEGDAAVRGALGAHIILRTSWLCGVNGNNFVKTMLRLGQEKETLRVVSDQYGCPTFAEDVAETIFIIASRILHENNTAWGTYHYTGKGRISWFDFAEEIFKVAREYGRFILKEIEPIPSEAYPTPARRPANSSLDCTLISETFGIRPKPWKDGLRQLIRRLLEDK